MFLLPYSILHSKFYIPRCTAPFQKWWKPFWRYRGFIGKNFLLFRPRLVQINASMNKFWSTACFSCKTVTLFTKFSWNHLFYMFCKYRQFSQAESFLKQDSFEVCKRHLFYACEFHIVRLKCFPCNRIDNWCTNLWRNEQQLF